MRSSFSTEFQEYLKGLDDGWLGYLENFRHALAHRIPLYIPPYVVLTRDEKNYHTLEARSREASARGDYQAYERLSAEQKKLKGFRPWMQHSFIEESQSVVFHAQLIADFNTIHELGLKMLKELDP